MAAPLEPFHHRYITSSSTPGTILVPPLNMIIKGKNGSTLRGGTVFQTGSRVEPFWLHFFSQCVGSDKILRVRASMVVELYWVPDKPVPKRTGNKPVCDVIRSKAFNVGTYHIS